MQTISVTQRDEKRSHGEIDLIEVRMPTEYRRFYVGAGLMFAGVTGLCPLASSIARTPWNRSKGGGSCSA